MGFNYGWFIVIILCMEYPSVGGKMFYVSDYGAHSNNAIDDAYSIQLAVNSAITYPRESTEFRVPMYWESLTKVPDMGTSKNLSNYADVGTALGTYSSVFTEPVFVWVPAPVILLRKALHGTLYLCRSVR